MEKVILDWDAIEKDNNMSNKYKNYAPEGVHTTKLADVSLTETPNNIGIQFTLAENDEYKFPKYGAASWIKTKRDSFRQHHMKEIFVVLGFTEDQARKAVEQCENKEDLGKAYLEMFKKAVPKAKAFDVVVFPQESNPQYTTWDFASEKVRMNRKKKEDKAENILEDATQIELTDEPF